MHPLGNAFGKAEANVAPTAVDQSGGAKHSSLYLCLSHSSAGKTTRHRRLEQSMTRRGGSGSERVKAMVKANFEQRTLMKMNFSFLFTLCLLHVDCVAFLLTFPLCYL